MAAGRSDEPTPLCLNFGTPDAGWRQDPAPSAVHQAAMEWISHQVALHLRSRGVNARRLSEELGDTATSWRNKLSGYRAFRLGDIVGIALAIDVTVLEAIPAGALDLGDLVPAEYRARLTHKGSGMGMPEFRVPGVTWTAAADSVGAWLKSEERHGRVWLVGREVLVQRVVASLHAEGLPSQTASASNSEAGHDVVWAGRSVRLSMSWHGLGVMDDIAGVTAGLAAVGQDLWNLAARSESQQTVLVVVAPAVLLANFRQIADLEFAGARQRVMSLNHAERLGISGAESMPDVHVELLSDDEQSPNSLWLMIKG